MGSHTQHHHHHHHHHPLTLELGLPSSPNPNPNNKTVVVRPPSPIIDDPEPTLTLGLYTTMGEERSGSAGSSVSNTAAKRERESVSSENVVIECGFIINSRGSEEDEEGMCPNITIATKKLRLTKHQSALLEDNFKLHTTLNTKQKQALADRLNLRPRQVEVWFQNRRARTKLKQTEVDCEYLKKCYETLTDENKRLQKELEVLKSMKVAVHPNLYMQLPAAMLTMCPSCERVTAGNLPVPSKTPFVKPHHLFPSFPNPYAAC